jgi:hypothetical protein
MFAGQSPGKKSEFCGTRRHQRSRKDVQFTASSQRSMANTQTAPPATVQSPVGLLNSSRDNIRYDKGLSGDLGRLPTRSRSSGLSGRGDILVITGTWGFTPSFHITGLQPAHLAGPKVRHVIAWAGASPMSRGQNQIPAGNELAHLAGPKVRHVTAWAGASPTSAGPGQPSPQTSLAL